MAGVMRPEYEYTTVAGKPRRYLLAEPRECGHCKQEFRPRQEWVNAGRGIYCTSICARRGTGIQARTPLEVARQRFWDRVDRSGGSDACWEWQGRRVPKGYGRTAELREVPERFAHRVAYHFSLGPIPAGMFVCHKCDNPPCCNPSHMFLGFASDNNADMLAKGRTAKGEASGASKLTEAAIREIRTSEHPARALAERYGVTRSTISMVRSRKTWGHVA